MVDRWIVSGSYSPRASTVDTPVTSALDRPAVGGLEQGQVGSAQAGEGAVSHDARSVPGLGLADRWITITVMQDCERRTGGVGGVFGGDDGHVVPGANGGGARHDGRGERGVGRGQHGDEVVAARHQLVLVVAAVLTRQPELDVRDGSARWGGKQSRVVRWLG
jgi:hypothetical protein